MSRQHRPMNASKGADTGGRRPGRRPRSPLGALTG